MQDLFSAFMHVVPLLFIGVGDALTVSCEILVLPVVYLGLRGAHGRRQGENQYRLNKKGAFAILLIMLAVALFGINGKARNAAAMLTTKTVLDAMRTASAYDVVCRMDASHLRDGELVHATERLREPFVLWVANSAPVDTQATALAKDSPISCDSHPIPRDSGSSSLQTDVIAVQAATNIALIVTLIAAAVFTYAAIVDAAGVRLRLWPLWRLSRKRPRDGFSTSSSDNEDAEKDLSARW